MLRPTLPSPGITPRAIIIAVILLPPNFYWLIVGEMEMGGGSYMLPSFIVPLYNVIFCLFALTLVNSLIKKSLAVPAYIQANYYRFMFCSVWPVPYARST